MHIKTQKLLKLLLSGMAWAILIITQFFAVIFLLVHSFKACGIQNVNHLFLLALIIEIVIIPILCILGRNHLRKITEK